MTKVSDRTPPSLQKSIAIGGIGFMLVSLCVFATVVLECCSGVLSTAYSSARASAQ